MTLEITNVIAKRTTTVAKITNAIAEITNDFAEITNAIAKTTNAVVEITNDFAKTTNDFAEITTTITQSITVTVCVAEGKGIAMPMSESYRRKVEDRSPITDSSLPSSDPIALSAAYGFCLPGIAQAMRHPYDRFQVLPAYRQHLR